MRLFSRGLWWAWALGALAIAAAVTAVLVSRGGVDSPSEAAEEWAQAALAGDDERAAELECDGYDGDRLMYMLLEPTKPTRMEATEENPTSSDSEPTAWRVVLSWEDFQGKERTEDVDVRLEDGDYVVC